MTEGRARRKPLLDEEAIQILEATARDDSLKPTARLRALELLERWKRVQGEAPAKAASEVVDGGDPMVDLDDLERQRLKRGKRAS